MQQLISIPLLSSSSAVGQLPLALALITLLSACSGSEPWYQEQKTFPEHGWRYQDSVTFEIQAQDTSNFHRLVFGVSLNKNYPYRNLYVKFRTQTPSGSTRTSLPQFVLAKPSGQWYVQEDWGGTYKFRQVMLNNVKFQESGTYRITAHQYMRRDTLPGIEAVSMRMLEMSPAEVEAVREYRDSIRQARRQRDTAPSPADDLPGLPPPSSATPSAE
jgi:gliding motility-associated lipoprotein GldH